MLDLSTLSSKEQVTAIFIGYYDRAPAPNGLNYWSGEIDNGASLVDTARAFAVVTESQTLYPALGTTGSTDLAGNVAFVTAVFQNLFGRDPNNLDGDGSGNYWVNELENGADIGQLILAIMGGAQGTDLAILTNKIEVGVAYAAASEAAGELGRVAAGDTILDDVTAAEASVAAAQATIDAQFPAAPVVVPGNTINLNPDAAVIPGTDGNDVFQAESGDLTSSIQLNGGNGVDALSVFNETTGTVAVSPRTESVEQFYMTNQANDLNSVADNNVGGYSNSFFDGDFDTEVDVEIDGGRMVGVQRWETFDSRADLVIEDARDDTPEDGTFTDDITVAMVSTDPGNVDFAVYFDDPTNTSVSNSSLFVEVIDQENAATFAPGSITPATTGVLTESRLESFSFTVNGTEVTIELPDDQDGNDAVYGPNASYQSLTNAIQTALDNDAELQALGQSLTATLLDTRFDEAASLDNPNAAPGAVVFGLQIEITGAQGVDLVATNTDSSAVDPNTDIAARVTSARVETSQLITLNVELDDVGKGSTGGDAMFGAMSTGRQNGDDGTSDSPGIQQFNIAVDRSSALQTINSTNNALEVVNISNRDQSGINNTTNASDEASGDLAVRGQANPGVETQFFTTEADAIDTSPVGIAVAGNGGFNAVLGNAFNGIATDGAMPGAAPQHNAFGFTDVRVINAAAMIGAADLTLELTEEIVEKYLDIQDFGSNGETDDGIVPFTYSFGGDDDEFFVNLSSDALDAAGTGSREDFNMSVSGGAGADAITTNIGDAVKLIDEQGQDYYAMGTNNTVDPWYVNSVSDIASTFSVDGGAGDDIIWTNGWGDFTIADGAGNDAVYTDNSGVASLSQLLTNIDRTINEHDQIDYVVGAAWALNAEGVLPEPGTPSTLTGATNEEIILGTAGAATSLVNGSVTIAVSFNTAAGATAGLVTDTDLDVRVTIPVSAMSISGGNVVITEQALNQAIKQAVNENATMNKVLEAVDGPGNSLIVYTKIDGAFAGTELDVLVQNFQFNNGPLTGVNTTPAGYDAGVDVEFVNYGGDSVAESDNTINVGTGNDVYVLSTNDATAAVAGLDGVVDDANTDLDGSSNETLVFEAVAFGSDTVLNFDAGPAAAGTGFDVLSFNAIDYAGTLGAAPTTTDDSISVYAEVANTNDTAALVASQYATLAVGDQAIAIVYDVSDDNTGSVYLLTGAGAATDAASVFEHGEISLIGTDWATLTADNFA